MKKIIYLLIVVSICACQRKPGSEQVSPETPQFQTEKLDLNKALIHYPASLLSSSSTLEFEFKEPVVPAHFIGIKLDKDPLSFEPAIRGDAQWTSQKVLIFKPVELLPPGKTIKVTLNGKAALGEQKNVNDFTFTFKVAEQEVIGLAGDFVAMPDEKNKVRYEGQIKFSQPVDLNSVKNDLEARGPDGRLKLEISQSSKANILLVQSSSVKREKNGKGFTFNLPGKYTANNKPWQQKVILPGINVFRVLAHMDMSDPAADVYTYGIRFSDPVRENMDLSGFVTISPDIEFVTKVKGKYLTVEGQFQPGKEYTINIAKGFPSVYGTELVDDYSEKFYLNNIKPELNWLSEGVYLPTSNDFKLQFKSVNIARVLVKVYEIYPQNIGFFIQDNVIEDNSNDFSSDYYYYRGYRDLDRVAEIIYENRIDISSIKNKWIKTELNLGPVFQNKRNSVFVVNLTFDQNDLTGKPVSNRNQLGENDLYFAGGDYYSDPCRSGYYYSRGDMNKLLISSDIGLTVKKAGDGIHVFAANILTAKPMSGLKLELYNYQNKLMESKITNSNGYAFFTEDGSYIFGRDNAGIALIKLNHHQWELNNFDIAGYAGEVKGVNAFIYTDRGVHRPGDTIYLSAIIRMNSKSPSEDQPVLLTIKNARDQNVLEAKTKCGFNGHVFFSVPTDLTDPTGNWMAFLKIADQTFTKTLKVETVKPNRLKIVADVPERISAPDNTLHGTITSNYLFGAPAANLKTNVRLELSHKEFIVPKFSEFTFSTPLKYFSPMDFRVYEGNLNEDGQAEINYSMDNLKNANGLVRGMLHTTVYEKGGSFTENYKNITISPFTAFVGVGNIFSNGTARFGEKYNIPVIVVDQAGDPVSGEHVQIEWYVERDHWWWHYDRRDQRDFKRSKSTFLIEKSDLTSNTKPVNYNITIEDYGRHYIEITDLSSGHTSGFFFYVSQWGRVAITEGVKERNYLEIYSDKNVYQIGDNAQLSFDTPGEGMVVLCLEKGDKILHREWKRISGNHITFDIPVTDKMIPNCYASVFLVQPHNQNTNDLPMRLYGVKTLYVEDSSTHLPLALSVPAELRPGQDFSVKVTSEASQKASYTIAVVDEGLLDLTAFETPSPWNFFFQKIMLAVKTLDNYDEIIGILYPDIDKYFTIGGDELEEGRLKRLDQTGVKRFIPVVLYHEPVTIKPGETVETRFTMPNYIGSVRVMVIGAAGNSYVSLEETIPVKQELMVLPTIPRVTRPGDTFAVPVSVFSMDDAIKSVNLSLNLSANLKAVGAKTIKVPFSKPGEKDTLFMVQTGNAVGADTIRVEATSGPFKADYTVHLPVSSQNPFYTDVTDTMVLKGQSVTVVPKKFGLEGTNSARIVFSRLPDLQLDERLRYLIRYPYGCIEQTVSSAFPQLFLNSLIDLRDYQKQEVTDHINEAIKKLTNFQYQSGFSYWPVSRFSRSEYSDWGTSYTGHFLLEAKDKGYYVPDDLYKHWLNDAKDNAKRVNTDNHRYQTYRLFLLALAGSPDMGAMNLVRENYLNKLDPLSRKLLAAAYYISGQKDAATAIDRTTAEIPGYRELSGTYGSALRDRAMMLYLCKKMEDNKTATLILKNVMDSFSKRGWYSTQETAMALLGISSYYKDMPGTGGMVKFKVKIAGEKDLTIELSGYQNTMDVTGMWDKEITISTENSEPLFVTLYREGIPLESRIKTENQGIELTRTFYNQLGYPVEMEVQDQGQSFWVVYTVKNIYGGHLEELALTSVFPAGWEIINTRLTGADLPDWIRKMNVTSGEYMDIRDDRVNWFFDLYSGRQVSFAVNINPTFKGTFHLPPVAVEAMYSPEYYARIEGGQVSVK
ncbi:hypothetical protein JXQ31_15055 [candidate division KSB1 bacterium]|nr:hypothetical protein [candidate division KSB1 bacterium]